MNNIIIAAGWGVGMFFLLMQKHDLWLLNKRVAKLEKTNEAERQRALGKEILRKDAPILQVLEQQETADRALEYYKRAYEEIARSQHKKVSLDTDCDEQDCTVNLQKSQAAAQEEQIFQQAASKAIEEHLSAGTPVPVWRDGEIQYLKTENKKDHT